MKRLAFAITCAAMAATLTPAVANDATPLAVTAYATFIAPNTHAYAGTLIEQCNGTKAQMRVFLAHPLSLTGTTSAGIALEGQQALLVTVAAQNDALTVTDFGGKSLNGCIAPGAHVALVLVPLPGLEEVVGFGTFVSAP